MKYIIVSFFLCSCATKYEQDVVKYEHSCPEAGHGACPFCEEIIICKKSIDKSSNISYTRIQNWERKTMNNLADLREQIQEDIITYFSSLHLGMEDTVDELCQIVADRVTELQKKVDK